MADCRFEHITKRFGSVVAVNDFNLTIADKEFVTLVGPSGCGKSTTLNLLAGLEDPSEGLIYIDDKVVNEVPSGKRDIAMVFQSYALYPHMRVRENIGFGLKVRGMPVDEIERRVQEAAGILGIEPLLDRRPRELSGGQRQRVALGRAITRDPKIFLLDEPLSNLDAKLRTQMRADLKLLFDRLGGTVVYVTHDQAEAMTLSDRVVVMRFGVVQQVGAPLDLYDDPDNMFVAGFLGNPSMNFIECDLERQGDQLRLRTGEVRWPLPLNSSGALAAQSNDSFVLGIRPEDITVGLMDELDPNTSVPCTVHLVEHMGALNVIYTDVAEQRVVATMESAFDARTGDPARLAFKVEKIHIFDPETSQKVRF
ncbi:MAG: ABC transporter ATP-binding protein [Chloroflexi bacterium]|nr:ABC transporter ATP-binding protein [Chloroflexota bacterium]